MGNAARKSRTELHPYRKTTLRLFYCYCLSIQGRFAPFHEEFRRELAIMRRVDCLLAPQGERKGRCSL